MANAVALLSTLMKHLASNKPQLITKIGEILGGLLAASLGSGESAVSGRFGGFPDLCTS